MPSKTELNLAELHEFNKHVYETESIIDPIRLSNNCLMGYFSGNKFLFVGQNPGQPHSYTDGHSDTHQNLKGDFNTVQEDYYHGLVRCSIGKYTAQLVSLLGAKMEDVSFTNVYKYSTLNNEKPGSHNLMLMRGILERQISRLKPEKVIAYGAFASASLAEIRCKHARLHHPASHNYSKSHIEIDTIIIKRFRS